MIFIIWAWIWTCAVVRNYVTLPPKNSQHDTNAACPADAFVIHQLQ